MKLFETSRRCEKAGTPIKAAVARCWQRGRGVWRAPMVFVLGWGPAGFLSPYTQRASPALGAPLHPTGRLQEPCTAQPELRGAKAGSGRAGASSCSEVVLPDFVTRRSRGGENFALRVFGNSPAKLLRRNQVVWTKRKLSRESFFLLMQF